MFLFFDLDDTLLDYQAAVRAAAGMFWADHLSVFGWMGRETFISQWESLAARLTQQAIAGQIAWDDQRRSKLVLTHIIDRFKVIVISSAVGVHKPDRGIFRHACDMAGCPPRDCIFVGDQLVSDARAAREVGMEGIWLNRRGQFVPGCDVETIETLADLPDLLGLKRRDWL